MDMSEHLRTAAAEECGEIADAALRVQKILHKSLRFGLDSVNPEDLKTNAQALRQELNDLQGVVELLQESGVLPQQLLDRELIDQKKQKVRKYMGQAVRGGTLQIG